MIMEDCIGKEFEIKDWVLHRMELWFLVENK